MVVNLGDAGLPPFNESIYRGCRHPDGTFEVWVEQRDGAGASRIPRRPLDLRLDIRSHSPTGFAWGYGGSGPAQLALALLLDVVGNEEIALRYYQDFKEYFVSGWDSSWAMTATEIRNWVSGRASGG